jgi:peptidyl-prolyl cis-trans isomerase-like protein 2
MGTNPCWNTFFTKIAQARNLEVAGNLDICISKFLNFLYMQVKSRYTTGAASRSFTSTSYDPVTENEYEYVHVERNPKKKGYVRMHTNHGDLNIELHCDITPRTCENFITLCERGYYDNLIFHRSIRNFMIQGGDPTGTGRGGESIWGKPFKDELNSKLLHSERGILSMANSGPHSNGSQFFILYKSAQHLNYKHTVFGRVVGGLEVLTLLEKVPVDDDDRPLVSSTLPCDFYPY